MNEYNTRSAVSSIPNEVFREKRCKKGSMKCNKCRSYIYFWRVRWYETVESLVDQSKRPHHYPNEHTPDELKLIRDMWQCNPARSYRALVQALQAWLYPSC